MMAVQREIMFCADASIWEAWLAENQASSPGVRLAIAKKGAAASSASYLEAVEVALCYGWIDGQRSRLDDEHFLQLFTPRGPSSIWSQVNQGRVAQLIEAGRMSPSGQAEIDKAKANGRWAMGCSIRSAKHDRSARRPGGGAGCRAGGIRSLRDA
ncbi:YdeI/OmpD-associated family protein [Leifsonia sp. A12D58]|uniref:YdeI/OmpD-associated family protein n=1 Tax=Leifsonia sp. A12D58 TaxID=3397674 RepID=UPI0039E04E3C